MASLLFAVAAQSEPSNDTLMNLSGQEFANGSIADAGSVTGEQILASRLVLRINVDGYNRERDIEVAKDTRELLSLARDLKAELDQNPGDESSPAILIKLKEIEKLARDVKEKMQMVPVLGPL